MIKSPVERFRSDWHDMAKIDSVREKLLNKEHREVMHEMVAQACQEGTKTIQEIADDYHIHKTTVHRIIKGKGLNK